MSATTTDDSQKYRIETRVSAGVIKDPVTGEQHEIEGHDDKRGGVITVDRPDSAKYIVDRSSTRQFIDKAPKPEAVKEAQRAEFDFVGSDVCTAFAESRNKNLGDQELGPAEGFDPETDDAYNDKRIKALKMYERLQSNGYDDEAEYLRALGSETRQHQFCKFLREHDGVNL